MTEFFYDKEKKGKKTLLQIFSGIYARTSKNLFFVVHCGMTNTQKISAGIRRQPSLGTQQRNKMQGSNDGECDIN